MYHITPNELKLVYFFCPSLKPKVNSKLTTEGKKGFNKYFRARKG